MMTSNRRFGHGVVVRAEQVIIRPHACEQQISSLECTRCWGKRVVLHHSVAFWQRPFANGFPDDPYELLRRLTGINDWKNTALYSKPYTTPAQGVDGPWSHQFGYTATTSCSVFFATR